MNDTNPLKEALTDADNRKNWITTLTAFFLLIYECVIFIAAMSQQISLILLLFLHLLAVCAACLLCYLLNQKNADLRYPLLLAIALLAGGPLGNAGFLFFAMVYPIAARYATPFSIWLQGIFLEHEHFGQNIADRIQVGWDDYSTNLEITPFLDIFIFGSLSQKQAALDAIAKEFDPIYAPILKSALGDENNTLRIQAAAIVSKIDLNFEKKLNELLKKMDENNDNPKEKKPELFLELAKLFDARAHAGILNPILEKEAQDNALYYYRAYLDQEPSDLIAWQAIGRLLFRAKNYEGVISWFDDYRKYCNELPSQVLPWYLESLYCLKRYANLATVATSSNPALEEGHLPEEVMESIKTWVKK